MYSPPFVPVGLRNIAVCVASCALLACGRAPARPTETTAVASRHFALHLPERPAVGNYPLVIALHGGFGNGVQLERTIGLDAIADREGFAVVYPDGLDHHWNDGRGDASGAADVDDVAYVRSLIDELAAKYPIDPNRVYAMGISNGGIMSYRLACELADKLAAIASVAGEVSASVASTCHPSRAISVLEIHGTADPLVPWNGGDVRGGRFSRGAGSLRARGEVIGVRNSVAMFAANDGCAAEPTITPETKHDASDATAVKDVVYLGCAPGTAVELLEIDGGGHTWPGGTGRLPERLVGATSHELVASERIWRFFADHPRR